MNKFSKILKISVLASVLAASTAFAANVCNSHRGDFRIIYVSNGQDSFLNSMADLMTVRNRYHANNTHHELFYNTTGSVNRFVGRQAARLSSLSLEGNRVVLIGNQDSIDRFGSQLVPQSSGTVVLVNSRNNLIDRMDNALVDRYLTSLVIPVTNASSGFFTVTMTWDGYGDVDLHTDEPSGDHVYYGHKRGASGYLDQDNTYANGPEHYYASCESSVLREGVYNIKLKNFSGATGRTATVQVSTSNDGEIFTRRLGVGTGSLLPVVKVRVSQSHGQYTATIANSGEVVNVRR